jgi:hypothetical protein
VRGLEPWAAAAMSSLMIAVVPELTCYYYSFLAVLALLYYKRKEAGIALVAVTALTSFVDWAPTQFLSRSFPWKYLRVMPTWLAEQYTLMSVVTLAGIGWIIYDFGWRAHRTPAAVEAVPAPPPPEKPRGGPETPRASSARHSKRKRRH